MLAGDRLPVPDPGTVAGALDFETTSSYSLTVEVSDNGTPVLSDTATISITIMLAVRSVNKHRKKKINILFKIIKFIFKRIILLLYSAIKA